VPVRGISAGKKNTEYKASRKAGEEKCNFNLTNNLSLWKKVLSYRTLALAKYDAIVGG
jgi:hypothetical protein